MKINKTYRALLDKAMDSMLSAIEIYNKPNFNYREETFAVLAINAWELLLKAYILRENRYNLCSIYVLEPSIKKNGTKSKRKIPKLNRCKNPMSISILEAISILESQKKLPKKLKDNLDSLIELRDNAIHFVSLKSISRQIQELGFACVKNFIGVIKCWNLDLDISSYNLYLMPLAYVDEKLTVPSVITAENESYLAFVKHLLETDDGGESDFDIAISIDIDFKKGNTFDSVGVHYDADGVKVELTEENIKSKFPWSYKEMTARCRTRYSDFKQDTKYNGLVRDIKLNKKLCVTRPLYFDNPKSQKTYYYSSNVLQFFDKYYTKK